MIPESVTTIGYYAFYNCTGLTSVVIPDSVNSIEEEAFSECGNLNVTVGQGSYAEKYCAENGIPFVYAG